MKGMGVSAGGGYYGQFSDFLDISQASCEPQPKRALCLLLLPLHSPDS